jgi:DNA-binding NtrC family response regulator
MQSGGTILLVDDEESATTDAAPRLSSLGYQIATASDVASALAKVGTDESMLAMLVDITLSGAGQLVRHVARRHPAVRIIFTTSYPEMLLLDREVPDDRPLLRKPLDADKVRVALTSDKRNRRGPATHK